MKEKFIIKYKKFDESKDLFVPEYKSDDASGMDLMSIDEFVLPKNAFAMVSTNLSVEIPRGYEIQIRPRSGLAAKCGVTVLNTPGTIDSDYRGEIKVILINLGTNDFTISKGDRIAQMVLAKVPKMELFHATLSETLRGNDGFGSTGINSK